MYSSSLLIFHTFFLFKDEILSVLRGKNKTYALGWGFKIIRNIYLFYLRTRKLYRRLCPSVRRSIGPSVCWSVHLSVGPSVRWSIGPSVCWSVGLLVHPSVRPSVRPSICPSIRPSVRPSVRPFVCPSFHLSVHPSVSMS